MAIIDQRTTKLDLPLPYVENDLFDDVSRLREAFNKIDTFAAEGTAAAAVKLINARKINGVLFNGTADITIEDDTKLPSGANAVSATKLAVGSQINGVLFDGTTPITIADDTKLAKGANAVSATKLVTSRKINGVEFNGTADITITDSTKLPSGGTAVAAAKLATARNINGVPFDGTQNITIDTTDGSKLPLTGGTITGSQNSTSTGTGALRVAGGVGVGGNLYAGGNVVASNVVEPSDERLKTDIESISGALAKVLELRGVTYTDIASSVRRTGVIAQEVQKVLPEAVIQNGEYLAVAYGNIVGLLISAINELSAKVEDITPRHKRGK